MRVVLMGSPDFALPTLRQLAASYPVVGVVTQPDRPAGRGRRLAPPPVKEVAIELGLPVAQPENLRSPEALEALRRWAPDLIVVVAYGEILRSELLDLPGWGCVNLHASLLPRHRGAAPIPAAILSGEGVTGITLMRMDQGMDTGPILAQASCPIDPDDTSLSLGRKLAGQAAEVTRDFLPQYLAGDLIPEPQDARLASYAPALKKDAGRLRFGAAAPALCRQVRAYFPWPGAYTYWRSERIKVNRARLLEARLPPSAAPGLVLETADGPAIACAEGALLLIEVQPAGRRPMSAADFVHGAPSFVGAVLE